LAHSFRKRINIKAKTYMVVAFLRNNGSFSKEFTRLEYDMFFSPWFLFELTNTTPSYALYVRLVFAKKKEQKYFHEITLCTN